MFCKTWFLFFFSHIYSNQIRNLIYFDLVLFIFSFVMLHVISPLMCSNKIDMGNFLIFCLYIFFYLLAGETYFDYNDIYSMLKNSMTLGTLFCSQFVVFFSHLSKKASSAYSINQNHWILFYDSDPICLKCDFLI